MIIYNVTVKIDTEAHLDWLGWMIEKHIPDVMATGLFSGYRLSRVLGQDENDGITYSIQYHCSSLAELEKYSGLFAPKLQNEHNLRYQGRYVAFRSFMEVLEEEHFNR